MIEANILIGFEGGAEFWAVGTTRVVDDELGHVEDKNQKSASEASLIMCNQCDSRFQLSS